MGIHGLFKEIGLGQRISLAKLSSDHYIVHGRPLRLAIDISIWLFQIQSGKGGSNPALRTFYYRLLRLLTLNIHPLFIFDGPHKPLFKRNKKVGGPGVRVASVPEFLAKQLLKQFGFPWHIAPGEAEAECALLQREGIIDAVLSEDVDTLMFGSGITLRNWTSDNSTKTPTHVNVYRATETKEKSGMDREGMILVALMSGGDYLPDGIPGCGPKLACDAARAGYGHQLCHLGRKDAAGLSAWKTDLQHQINTNEAKHFSRRNTSFAIPNDFPNREVLGYYTHPCVSTAEKLVRLKRELVWDQEIDFAALRLFTADAFDWRCISGAKKFIRNLAPAMLVRKLRLEGQHTTLLDLVSQAEREKTLVRAIHGKRNHSTTDGELEYRISFTPASLVPIDLSIEDEDDEIIPAGDAGNAESDAESDLLSISSSAPGGDNESETPLSPSKKRNFKPYFPDQPEKLWLLKPFLQIGCPLLIEDYEASFKDHREFLKARRKAKAATKGSSSCQAAGRPRGGKKAITNDMPHNALLQYGKITKAQQVDTVAVQKGMSSSQPIHQLSSEESICVPQAAAQPATMVFKLPSTQVLTVSREKATACGDTELPRSITDVETSRQQASRADSRPFAAFGGPQKKSQLSTTHYLHDVGHSTPRRTRTKRPSTELSSPASQRTITSFYSPSPRKPKTQTFEDVIDLVSSSPTSPRTARAPRYRTTTPPDTRFEFVRSSVGRVADELNFFPGKLPDTVTKRRKRGPLQRARTAPTLGFDDEDELDLPPLPSPSGRVATPETTTASTTGNSRTLMQVNVVEALDLTSSTPMRGTEHPSRPHSSPRNSLENDRRVVEVDDNVIPEARTTFPPATLLAQVSPLSSQTRKQAPTDQGWSFDTLTSDHESAKRTISNDPNFDIDLSASSIPTPLVEDHKLLPTITTTVTKQSNPRVNNLRIATQAKSRPRAQALCRSPRPLVPKKKHIQLRESLEGWWKEVEAEAIDMSGDSSGWKKSGGRATTFGTAREFVGSGRGWRKSGVEVLDLTGA